ncbi:uncharacterized protein MONOS_507 [Monocercomonoides exilis]|uniref:uncharacterized protein n=1 Tax=Monocercomonoides exilis TaxID=2049356 RepID=UPI00355A9EF1|nr:hypothetical protein MONOS_507 [Monocercomonoides exilis]|eukprot:MONOS_507.1-p1 / transcript=MONOS_507.1 / gene=MONOS_507 / organism=Monocercomonoides_exilis_PA203 / gene_product=unspecified product / transcript_product=unspecified product / location=Mono_scaffold00008:71348-78103(+) / protein_length=2252 / sequence_SO=supercontig / SO=protein_coding / is_pseudo=false
MGGGICLADGNHCYSIRECNFSQSTGHYYGGGLYITDSSLGTDCVEKTDEIGSNACIDNCLFDYCTIEDLGGGSFCIDVKPSPFAIRSCSFFHSHASCYGGALYLNFAVQGQSIIAPLFFCFFHNCSVSIKAGKYGDVLFIGGGSVLRLDPSPLVSCFFTNPSNDDICVGAVSGTISAQWIKAQTTHHLGVEGNDSKLECGLSHLFPCRTMQRILSRDINSSFWTIQLGIGMHSSDIHAITVQSATVYMSGQDIDKCVFSTQSISGYDADVSVCQGTLNFSVMTIQRWADKIDVVLLHAADDGCIFCDTIGINSSSTAPSLSPFSAALISCSPCGYVQLTEVTVAEMAVYDTSLLPLLSPSIALLNCSFKSITRTSGSGCVVEQTVHSTEDVQLDNISFTNCLCVDGNGGGVYAEVTNESRVSIGISAQTQFVQCIAGADANNKKRGGGIYLSVGKDSTNFELTSVTFQQCSAWQGSNVFIISETLSSVVHSPNIAFHISLDREFENEAMGCSSNNLNYAIPLLFYLTTEFPTPAFVGGQNCFDFEQCGFSGYPCATIPFAVRLRFQDTERTITLNPGFMWNDALEMNDHLWILTCVEKRTSIPVVPPTSMPFSSFIRITISTSFSNILFQLPPSLNGPSTFIASSIQGGVMTIEHCDFTAIQEKETIRYGMIGVEKGQILLCNCTVNSTICSTTPFEVISTTKITEIETTTVTVTVNSCVLTNVESLYSTNGGAMSIRLDKDGILNVVNITAHSCECCSTDSKGGFMYLDATQAIADSPFLFSSVNFNANRASLGNSLFISAKDLNKSIISTSFLFNYSMLCTDSNEFVGSDEVFEATDLFRFLIRFISTTVHLSSAGYDAIRCGSPFEPCHTLSMALSNLDKNTFNRTILVNGTISIEMCADLTNMTISSLSSGSHEEEHGILLFQTHNSRSTFPQDLSNISDSSLTNSEFLTFSNIQIRTDSSFCNTNGAVVLNKDGSLIFKSCVFVSEQIENSIANEFKSPNVLGSCSYVRMLKGRLFVDALTVDACQVASSAFTLNIGCTCTFSKLNISSVTVVERCIIAIDDEPQSEGLTMTNSETEIAVSESCIGSSSALGLCACFVSSESNSAIRLQLNASSLLIHSAPYSQKGGCVAFHLGIGGALSFSNLTMAQCCCSATEGRGGAVHVSTMVNSDFPIPILFENMTFRSNTAHIGNDVFVQCTNIQAQINEEQFLIDFRDPKYNPFNSIWGCDTIDNRDVDLMDFITIYMADTIVVSYKEGNPSAADDRSCGSHLHPCLSLNYASHHLSHDFISALYVDTAAWINSAFSIANTLLSAKITGDAITTIRSPTSLIDGTVVMCTSNVTIIGLTFKVEGQMPAETKTLFAFCAAKSEIRLCNFTEEHPSSGVVFELFSIESCQCELSQISISRIYSCSAIIALVQSSLSIFRVSISDVKCGECIRSEGASSILNCSDLFVHNATTTHPPIFSYHFLSHDEGETPSELELSSSIFSNLTKSSFGQSAASSAMLQALGKTFVKNTSFSYTSPDPASGCILEIAQCPHVELEQCVLLGTIATDQLVDKTSSANQLCSWNGSALTLRDCSSVLTNITITNSSAGALGVIGGSSSLHMCSFANNSPNVPSNHKYPSYRRNIRCTTDAALHLSSLIQEDLATNVSSLWILSDSCTLSGLPLFFKSPFFVPLLASVQSEELGSEVFLRFKGYLLLPCNLSFMIVKQVGEEKEIVKYSFLEEGYVSETEVKGIVEKELISSCGEETEVSVSILFGDTNNPSSTDSFILKNRSEPKTNGDARIAEGGKEGKSIWPIIVVILAVVLLIILIIAVISTVRWRKQKRRTEELEVIVADTVKKDPKAFEMVTMEMSPEEQWRRAEREAEKKNEERMKKRVYEKSLGHSESSEHLLSESGSTEYILGRDSDKIPEWMLEKVEEKEEEEVRKQTPSPSISSTSTTDTSDTESTFVRSESLCPTTSSMSNLVDAMACSSPHEKLIVDLRDSLFMLLHGRNKTKEMAIGTLEERVITAAQILFWVANLALHSFDEMENPLQSLANLSPHIVLFSEHMVICIVMHSDFSSSDSDSSSISSTTVVTSASDDDGSDSLPSSAFEDEDGFKKECLRWKAPELLINKKMGATKESVAFSIGMMLWECLTLQIPFGDYEGEMAGQKIVNGERPRLEMIEGTRLFGVAKRSLSAVMEERPGLVGMKREFLGCFPPGTFVMTMSDAVGYDEESDRGRESGRRGSGESKEGLEEDNKKS